MYDRGIKRIIDLILSVIIFLILLPVFVIIIFAIKIDSKGPVFFKQKRVGKGKSYFEILKFRTMYIDTPKDMPTHLLKERWQSSDQGQLYGINMILLRKEINIMRMIFVQG